MKELAEQAATGTYNSDQRLMINSEFQAMGAEIDRIAFATNFNGQLSSGWFAGFRAQWFWPGSYRQIQDSFWHAANDSAEDYYYIGIGDASLRGLGLAAPTPDWWNAAEIDFENRKILIDLEALWPARQAPMAYRACRALIFSTFRWPEKYNGYFIKCRQFRPQAPM